MVKLLNDQLMNLNGYNQSEQQIDILVADNERATDKQSEIDDGNLQDYLEVFGGVEDI